MGCRGRAFFDVCDAGDGRAALAEYLATLKQLLGAAICSRDFPQSNSPVRLTVQANLTANQMEGRAVGILFFTGFGAVWFLLGLYVKERLTALPVCLMLSGIAVLGVGAIFLMRRAKALPRVPEDPAVSHAFKWINIIQWIAVAAVAFAFARLGIDAYVVSAITAIVGLHMFPLARLFRYPLHYGTGAALVAWAVASVLLFNKDEMQGSTAFGTGTILWTAALLTLLLAIRSMTARREHSL